jgi:hypothetical protein
MSKVSASIASIQLPNGRKVVVEGEKKPLDKYLGACGYKFLIKTCVELGQLACSMAIEHNS